MEGEFFIALRKTLPFAIEMSRYAEEYGLTTKELALVCIEILAAMAEKDRMDDMIGHIALLMKAIRNLMEESKYALSI